MTETLTAESTRTARPALRIPEGIEVLPSTPNPDRTQVVSILITRIANGSSGNVHLHRTAMARRSHAYSEGFITDPEASPYESMFVDGALMNPTPVEGAFYLHPVASPLVPADSGLHYVSQYRDGEWRIVLPVSPCNTVMWSGQTTGSDRPQTPYYRVKAPLDLIPDGWAYTPDDVTEVTDRSTQMVLRGHENDAAPAPEAPEENPIPENLRPHAADGAVLNETPEPGVLYALSLYGGTDHVIEFAYPHGPDSDVWYVSHDLSAPSGGEPQINGRRMHRTTVVSTGASKWVRARTVTVDSLPITEGAGAATRLTALRLEAAELTTRWEAYEESLNEVADEHSWCPDFERILEPLDMKGREDKKQRTGTVDVTLTWEGEWEHHGISSTQDELIGEALNFEHPGSVSINRMTMDLTGRVTIRRTGIPLDSDGDAVYDDADDLNIDPGHVEAAVTLHTGGTLEVEDFAVDTVRFVNYDD